jgi:glycosyltransferase involved in cell wall biosynthesis
MIRVLHVIDHLDLGGAQTALVDMLRHCDRTAFEVEVAVMHGRGPFADALEELGIRVHSLARAKWPPAYVTQFLRLLRGADFHVVHFHLQGANWIAKPLAALAGQRVLIAHEHSSGDLRFRGLRSLIPNASTHLFSTRIVAVSKGVRDFLTRWEAISSDLIEVVPNAVDENLFQPCTHEQRRAARSCFSLPVNAFVAGGIGRLAHEKHFILLAELAARHPNVYFVVAGSGPEGERIAARVDELGVKERVRLLGTILDRPTFYHALDVFLLPSLFEGLPMALLEAMFSGVPVLSSRLEGISAIIVNDQEALLVSAGDVEDFSRQLRRLEASPELRRHLAANARANALQKFSASVTARRIEDIYRHELAIANTKLADKTSGS